MAELLDSRKTETACETISRKERREIQRQRMREEITLNQSGNGVIIIPPPKKTSHWKMRKGCVLQHTAG